MYQLVYPFSTLNGNCGFMNIHEAVTWL